MTTLVIGILTILCLEVLHTEAYKVCAKSKSHKLECEYLEKEGWSCFLVNNIIDCLENLNNGKVDLALITHEEADLVADNFTNLEIVGQVRPIDAQHKNNEFNLTVITREEITKFSDIKKLRICHPGYDKLKVPPYMLYTFESEILEKCKSTDCFTDCSSNNKTLLRELCIPCGRSSDSVCERCGDDCPSISEPFNFSLNCLQKKSGDVAVTTLHLASQFFQTDNFTFLTRSGVSSNKLGSWRSKLWPMILSNRDKVNKISEAIQKIFPEKIIDSETFSNDQSLLNSYLSTILLKSQSDKIFLQKTSRQLKEFMKGSIALLRCHNSSSIRWCTNSRNEEEKCKWFAKIICKYITLSNIKCVFHPNCSEEFNKTNSEVDVFSTDRTNLTIKDFGGAFAIIKTTDVLAKWTLVMKKELKSDVRNILKAAIKLFAGTSSYKPFELFAEFREEPNLLFPDETSDFLYNLEVKVEDEGTSIPPTNDESTSSVKIIIITISTIVVVAAVLFIVWKKQDKLRDLCR